MFRQGRLACSLVIAVWTNVTSSAQARAKGLDVSPLGSATIWQCSFSSPHLLSFHPNTLPLTSLPTSKSGVSPNTPHFSFNFPPKGPREPHICHHYQFLSLAHEKFGSEVNFPPSETRGALQSCSSNWSSCCFNWMWEHLCHLQFRKPFHFQLFLIIVDLLSAFRVDSSNMFWHSKASKADISLSNRCCTSDSHFYCHLPSALYMLWHRIQFLSKINLKKRHKTGQCSRGISTLHMANR